MEVTQINKKNKKFFFGNLGVLSAMKQLDIGHLWAKKPSDLGLILLLCERSLSAWRECERQLTIFTRQQFLLHIPHSYTCWLPLILEDINLPDDLSRVDFQFWKNMLITLLAGPQTSNPLHSFLQLKIHSCYKLWKQLNMKWGNAWMPFTGCINMCLYVHVCLSVYVCTYVRVCVYVCIYMCVCELCLLVCY